jgi:hypothetical protein
MSRLFRVMHRVHLINWNMVLLALCVICNVDGPPGGGLG